MQYLSILLVTSPNLVDLYVILPPPPLLPTLNYPLSLSHTHTHTHTYSSKQTVILRTNSCVHVVAVGLCSYSRTYNIMLLYCCSPQLFLLVSIHLELCVYHVFFLVSFFLETFNNANGLQKKKKNKAILPNHRDETPVSEDVSVLSRTQPPPITTVDSSA